MSSGFGFFSIMIDVDNCLYGSIGQAETDAGWTNTWTTQTTQKTNDWLSGGISTPAVPGSLQAQIEVFANKEPDPKDVASFISDNLANTNIWSTALVVQLQTMIAKWYSEDTWSAVLGSASSLGSLISSAMTQDTTTGETEGKNMQSQLQTDNTALQPISDFGSSWSGFLSALANVLSQVGPGG